VNYRRMGCGSGAELAPERGFADAHPLFLENLMEGVPTTRRVEIDTFLRSQSRTGLRPTASS
jgi:hypothetical protein